MESLTIIRERVPSTADIVIGLTQELRLTAQARSRPLLAACNASSTRPGPSQWEAIEQVAGQLPPGAGRTWASRLFVRATRAELNAELGFKDTVVQAAGILLRQEVAMVDWASREAESRSVWRDTWTSARIAAAWRHWNAHATCAYGAAKDEPGAEFRLRFGWRRTEQAYHLACAIRIMERILRELLFSGPGSRDGLRRELPGVSELARELATRNAELEKLMTVPDTTFGRLLFRSRTPAARPAQLALESLACTVRLLRLLDTQIDGGSAGEPTLTKPQ